MPEKSRQIRNLNDLRELVNETLCDREQLEIGAFPMTERILVRSGKPCGIYFCLHGPRSVRCTAIWEMDRNTILFYGSTGERFHKALLAEPLPVEQLTTDNGQSNGQWIMDNGQLAGA